MLTIEEFNKFNAGDIIGSGEIENSPEGIYMTNSGGTLRWVAKKGRVNDWCVYCHWSHYSFEYVEQSGDKVMTKEYIQRCIPCSEEVFKLYRY